MVVTACSRNRGLRLDAPRGTRSAPAAVTRFASCFAVLVLAGCTDSASALEIDNNAPLGAGLTARYFVTQDRCDGCNPVSPSTLEVEVTSGPARVHTVTPFDGSSAWFELTGTGLGTATIAATGEDGVATSLSIDVVAVSSTTLVVQRHGDAPTALPDVASPAHAFTGSYLHLAQHNAGPNNTAVSGEADLALVAGVTHAMSADRDLVATGDTSGTAMVSILPLTSLHATLELDVVDPDAIADVGIADVGQTLEISLAQGDRTLYFLPADAGGNPIAGTGTTAPTVSISEPNIANFFTTVSPVARSVGVSPLHTGSATLDVTWGNVHKTFAVTVTP